MSNNLINKTIDVVIPVYKPGIEFKELIRRLQKQIYSVNHIFLMHTEDGYDLSPSISEYENITEYMIKKEEFDHGGTRNQGIIMSQADITLCMTQDAVPVDNKLTLYLVQALENDGVAVTYARQIPKKDCKLVERFTRGFNYPDRSRVKDVLDLKEMGIKTYFCSNVCAAYKRDIYLSQGGFAEKAIFNEDMIFAGKLIQAKYKIYYCAEAKVFHSHNYSCKEQFKRNFDMAVSQVEHPEVFGVVKSEKEGMKLIKQTIQYLLRKKQFYGLLQLIIQSASKYLGYKTGINYKKLPSCIIRKCTMNPTYWGWK